MTGRPLSLISIWSRHVHAPCALTFTTFLIGQWCGLTRDRQWQLWYPTLDQCTNLPQYVARVWEANDNWQTWSLYSRQQ